LLDTFQDFYTQVFGIPASSDVIMHCKRQLIHLIWLLILHNDFMHAYVHGFHHIFPDRIRQLLFPPLFTYATDYPEKVLLACIRYLAKCPCPQCYVLKDNISDMGRKRDMHNRSLRTCIDDQMSQCEITSARNAVFEAGMSFNCQFIENTIGKKSLTVVQSAFSTHFYEYGLNHYDMFVPDLLHEFELGVWKSTFVHLMRILFANGNNSIQTLNKRYRNVPTFGCGTIRRFGSNASSMKKLAACDYKDQCALPVFEGLLPTQHNCIMLNLLFELATWHALAKLRLHTETTIRSLEASTRRLGNALRDFKKEAARGHREAALCSNPPISKEPVSNAHRPVAGKHEKKFNLSTYKMHALGDYPHAIRMFGTTDGYISQVGEMQHKKVKGFYSRASKAHPTQSISKQQQRECTLCKITEREWAKYRTGQKGPMLLFEDEEKLPYMDPNAHYHIGSSTKFKLNIFQWPDEELEQDIAYKNWYPRLLDHLLARLNGIELFDGNEHSFSDADRSSIVLVNEAIYQHKVLRVNYTMYDLRRDQDSINPRTNADIMMAAHEDEPGKNPHHYWYARVMGIFHANVLRCGDDSPPKRMDFLWVRWFGRDMGLRAGWKSQCLHRIGFISSPDPTAYGFLDPALIIQSVHLILAFNLGRTSAYLTTPVIRPAEEKYSEWRQYYINMFVDRDMFMRFRGGGVGHKSTREATDLFLPDRHPSDSAVANEDENMNGTEEETMAHTTDMDENKKEGEACKNDDEDAEDENEPDDDKDEDNPEEVLGPEDGEDYEDNVNDGYGAL
ncbi:hypothetical protein AX14_005100, partial [Amanita brunnescens Koide BX004]